MNERTAVPWHTQAPETALARLSVDPGSGLTTAEVASRLESHGPNEIAAETRQPLWRLVARQLADFMILVLIAAALVSGIVGEPQDALAIVVIVVLNAAIGAVQEFRAERAVAALRQLAVPEARVRRDGQERIIPAGELVPGDIVLLEAGNAVAADLRLWEAADVRVDESALTGESVAVLKHPAPLAEGDLPLGDRRNMLYKGTVLTGGRAVGLVVGTGMETELGQIARLLERQGPAQTPLQKRLAQFGRLLAVWVLAITAVIFVVGLLRGEPAVLMFLVAVSLAVAAIPEALPAVVSVTLAVGARRMSGRNALVRRLPAVETLGSVTYICSDKTGTLTLNRMHAERFAAAGESAAQLQAGGSAAWRLLGEALALSNDVRVGENRSLTGDPTETALVDAARAAGYDKQRLEAERPRVAEIPFDSERKRMTTVHRVPGEFLVYVKGAPEAVLPQCSASMGATAAGRLDRERVLTDAETLADEGYRVLAVAFKQVQQLPDMLVPETVETDLVLLGLVALIDPPRPEAQISVKECRDAGITPVMITGDHPGTARAIARRLGIADEGADVLTGRDLAALSDAELQQRAARSRIYARVSPEQKIRIVAALQARGEFVAMTGDGVNDAPALKRANIGVAMGQKGTDVAREAADMVLLDDNFATIVAAVREGRRIFDNIRKFVKYTMTSNSGEIWTLFLAPFLGLPLPLLPIHILWINLVTDGLPGLALAAEPEERGIMRRPPRPPGESLFAHGLWQHILWVGLLIGGLSLVAQAWAIANDSPNWQTITFTVLTLSQLVHAMVIRSDRESLFVLGLRSNYPLLGAMLLTLGLQMAVIYVPFLNPIFKTAPLAPEELLVCFLLPLIVWAAVEVEKWLVRRGRIYQTG